MTIKNFDAQLKFFGILKTNILINKKAHRRTKNLKF